MPAPTISIDLTSTRRRTSRLRRYVRHTLLDGSAFICPHLGACRASTPASHQFREGIMSHVGRRFDLRLDDKQLRIVVVGQESGLPKDLRDGRVGMIDYRRPVRVSLLCQFDPAPTRER